MNTVDAPPITPTPATAATGDEDLVAGLVRRDEAAVALLLERWWSRAYRLAHQLTGDAAAAEDVAQESFVQALRAASGFDPARGAFAPWFLRIVRNAAFNAARARKRRVDHEVSAARERPEGATDDLGERADAAGVRAHLHALSPPYREALALHYLQGLTFQEVAEVLGCPLGTVASRMRRGLEALRARVTPTGALVAAPAAAPGVDPLVELLAQAWALVAPPVAPLGARLLERAAGPLVPAGLDVTAPVRWTSRLPALLALLGVLAAGTATFSLLLSDPATPPPPRQVVQTRPPRPTTPRVVPTPDAQARPTGVVVPTPTGAATPAGAADPTPPPAEEQAHAVDAVAYDATGERALVGRRDGHVELWDLQKNERLHRLAGHGARAVAVAFSPDGELGVSASYDGAARLWDLASGETVHVLTHATGAKRRVLALAVSPAGDLAATAGEDGFLHLWSLATGQRVMSKLAHRGPARAVVFDADGDQLLTAGEDHRLLLWSLRGEPLAALESDAGFSHAVLDGRDVALVAGAPRTVERFDLVRRERVAGFTGEGPLAVTRPGAPASAHGLLVRAGAGAFRFVDPDTGAEKVRFEDRDELLLAVTLAPDGRHALTGAESGRLKVWDLRPPDPGAAVVRLGPADSIVNAGDPGGERVVVAGASDVAGAEARTAILPSPTGVDVDALRRELARATRWRARQIARGLDARDPSQLDLLFFILADRSFDWPVRLAAVEALTAHLGDPRVQGLVLARLDRGATNDVMLEGVALALGRTRSPAFVPRLVRLLTSDVWFVRRAAAIALAWTPDARAVEPLIAALSENEARVATHLHAALERTTRAHHLTAKAWEAWWKDARRDFVLQGPTSGFVGAQPVLVQVDDAPRGAEQTVTWAARVRGQGPPMLVLPDLGYGPAYLECMLRWLEERHTLVYVALPEPPPGDVLEAATTARRLARLAALLRERGLIPDQPELVLGHGLSAAVASLYPAERPEAAGLVLVSPITTLEAWRDALARVERQARAQGASEREAAVRLLTSDAHHLPTEERAILRAELFSAYFADPRDLLPGLLLGSRSPDAHSHALEWSFEQRLPRYVARTPGWHEVPTLIVVGRDSLWSSKDDLRALSLQSRRTRVEPISRSERMPFYENREAFADALRWFNR